MRRCGPLLFLVVGYQRWHRDSIPIPYRWPASCSASARQTCFFRRLYGWTSHTYPFVDLHIIAWKDTIKLGVTHQNPALAPAPPLSPEDLGMDLSLYNANLTRRQLDKPNTGPLYCTDGPCVDDSCCGPKGICGYGPDFCEAGCTSNCNATAMCGEYSEDANMPCGMKLCCSATGWCGS